MKHPDIEKLEKQALLERIAELYLVGLLFPGVANSEVLTKIVTLTLVCTTACVIAFTATYLLQQHLIRKGVINR